MLVVISPAKALNSDPIGVDPSEPEYIEKARELAQTAGKLSSNDLKSLMKISDKLAILNKDRFQAFSLAPAPHQIKPAMFCFDGDTYKGLEAKTLSQDDYIRAQDHLRILSGLYGILRPLDGIQPYRLEMGIRLQTHAGKTLYQYWGNLISQALNKQAERVGTDVLVNCASQEYFKVVHQDDLNLKVVTPQFYEIKDGKPKIISFYAKRARGAMARFMIENRLTNVNELQDFNTGGYRFNPDLSRENQPAFSREYPDS